MNANERAECWILKQVVTTRYPLWSIRENEAGFHADDFHGVTDAELVSVLQGMFARGDLQAYRHVSYKTEAKAFIPTPSQIELGVRTPTWKPRFDFELTPQGGARWEQYFQPDWTRFLSSCQQQYRDGKIYWLIEASSIKAINGYLAQGIVDLSADGNGFVYEELVPWKATYWKTLPCGVRCRSLFRVPEHAYFPEIMPWFTIPRSIGTFPFPPPVDWDSLA